MSRILKITISTALCIGVMSAVVALLAGKRPKGVRNQEEAPTATTAPATATTAPALAGPLHELAPPDLPADYKIRRRDIIIVRVTAIPSNGTSARTNSLVGPDGTVFVRGLGNVPAEGCTTASLAGAVVDAFARRGQKVDVLVRVHELTRTP